MNKKRYNYTRLFFQIKILKRWKKRIKKIKILFQSFEKEENEGRKKKLGKKENKEI